MPWRSNGLKRLAAIVKQRCPRCLQGQVFATLFRTGAMYLSYGVAIIATAPVWLIMAWLGRSLGEVLLVIGPLLVLGCPWLFRYARVLWLHLDHAFDPR